MISILEELNEVLASTSLPVTTGTFKDTPLKAYAVITPLGDTYDIYGDNTPGIDVREVRMSVFKKGNYLTLKDDLEKLLLKKEFTITERRFTGCEEEYYHFVIDVAKYYEMEED